MYVQITEFWLPLLKRGLFFSKASKKNSAVVCFPPNGCCDHFSGHFRILKIEGNGQEKYQVKIKRQKRKRQKEVDKGGRRGLASIHPENMFCVHISHGKACHILTGVQERNTIIGV